MVDLFIRRFGAQLFFYVWFLETSNLVRFSHSYHPCRLSWFWGDWDFWMYWFFFVWVLGCSVFLCLVLPRVGNGTSIYPILKNNFHSKIFEWPFTIVGSKLTIYCHISLQNSFCKKNSLFSIFKKQTIYPRAHGLKMVLFEKWHLVGTCVHYHPSPSSPPIYLQIHKKLILTQLNNCLSF